MSEKFLYCAMNCAEYLSERSLISSQILSNFFLFQIVGILGLKSEYCVIGVMCTQVGTFQLGYTFGICQSAHF